MNWSEFKMWVTVFAAAIIIVLAAIGALVLLGKIAWAIWRKVVDKDELEIMKLQRTMEDAASMNLSQAINALSDAGICYNTSKKCGYGKRFKLPKYFWAGETNSAVTFNKARAFVTIVTWALDEGFANSDPSAELIECFVKQASKTPGHVLAVQGRLIQQVVGNIKFKGFLEQLDYAR